MHCLKPYRFVLRYIITASLVLLLSCNSVETSKANDYEVVSAFINSLIKEVIDENGKLPIDTLYINDSSVVFKDIQKYAENTNIEKLGISEELFKNFITLNSSRYCFSMKFDIHLHYRLISESEIDEFNNSKVKSAKFQDWVKAGGVKYISRVGFSKDYNEALFYYGGYAAPLAASGYLIHMKKDKNGWVVISENLLWVS